MIEAIIEQIPPPAVNRQSPFRALLFDSWFDKYRGALSLIFIQDGNIKVGDEIQSCHTKKTYNVKSLALLRPQEEPITQL